MFSAHLPTAGPARPRTHRRIAGLVTGRMLVGGSLGLIAPGALGRMPRWVPASTVTSGGVLLHTAVVVLRRAIAIRRSTREEQQ
jgi:hypothetical protein